jgi:phosphoribosyl 1,2-cyclic phosphodiesterase
VGIKKASTFSWSKSDGMLELVFLGTGGGRFAMITQKIRTGGLRILSDELNIHVDPGPGALVYSLEMGLNPQKINAILVSHSHLDHTNDAGVLIEAMTDGGTKSKGLLAAAHSVLHGNEICDGAVSNYHKRLPEEVVDARVGTTFKVGDIEVKACNAVHTDPDAVGFRFETKGFGSFAYMPDSEHFEGISDFYGGVRLLILSVLRPSDRPWKGHMTTDDAAKIISEVRPEMAVITHFGMLMIFKGPDREAGLIEKRTGVTTIAAKDGMRLNLGKEIHVGEPEKQADLSSFMEPS